MAASRAKKSTARAVPAGVKQPADRLGKAPRTRTVTIPLDDDAAQALEDTTDALESARSSAEQDRDSRVAQRLAARRAPGVVQDIDQVRAEVDELIEVELAPLEHAVQVARAQVAATSRTFTFRSLGNTAYQALLGAHPATDVDHEQVRDEGRGSKAAYHAETFAPALVQACGIAPLLDDEDIADIFTGGAWNFSEIALLFMAAYEVNTQRRVVPG